VIYQAIAELEKNNDAGALCIVVRTSGSTPRRAGSKMLVYADGSFIGTIGGGELESRVIAEALQSIQDGKPRMVDYSMAEPQRGDPGVCGGQMEVYVEPVLPKPEVIVIGCGHVGKAVVHLAKWLGYRVLVSDDRVELCNPEVIPEADAYYPGLMQDLPKQVRIKPWTSLVLTTRNVDVDVPGLPVLLGTPAGYVGVIGSRRRWEITRQKLGEVGISEQSLVRVHSPIGLELGGETPEEIALSIMAEIILVRGGRSAQISKLPE
jgi:xanthine dehydrogenase accessory factor